MNRALLDQLCCPDCRTGLALLDTIEAHGQVESGRLHCTACARDYPVVGFVPRFVPPENYASSFGFQWNQFRLTQLDSHTGRPISRDRFLRQSGWTLPGLAGRNVLDVGCGAGRFAEVVLNAGARLVALDYSSAVDACQANLGPHPCLDVVQGDIYRLPFRPACFDDIYCFGVLQHTPDVRRAFLCLPGPLRDGGRLAVDVYPRQWRNVFWSKYWLRPLTRRLPAERLFALVRRVVPVLLPASRLVTRVPLVGRKARYLLPVVNHEGVFPLSERQLREWAVLDTFDMLAPTHDHPQSEPTLRAWFVEAGLRSVEVFRAGQVVGRGVRPRSDATQSDCR
jgi:SAM-dependent methyltransferase